MPRRMPEALMIAHGITARQPAALVRDGLATATTERMLVVAVSNEGQTRRLMARIDQAERDCETLVGAHPAFSLWQRCRLQSQIVSVFAGVTMFATVAVAVLGWRRERRKRQH